MALIKFKQTQEADEESFVETSIIAMRFFDAAQSRWRHFAAFNLKEEATGWQGSLLFEVLMEFETFALLSRTEKADISMRQTYNAYTGTYTKVKVGYEQVEKLCLAQVDGTARVVLAVTALEKDPLVLVSKIKPELNKKAIEKCLGTDWTLFHQIVKDNHLKLKIRKDFMRAFELYKEQLQTF